VKLGSEEDIVLVHIVILVLIISFVGC